MGDKSGIQWTDATWNCVRGCSLVSPGCTQCYAMKQAHRMSGPGGAYEGLTRLRDKNGPVWTGEVRLVPEMLEVPLRWKRPRRIFVNSMSDIFHEGLSNEQIAAVFGVMAAAPQHTFQILTKRAERMRNWFQWVDEKAQKNAGADPSNPWWRVLECATRAPFKGKSSVYAPFSAATWPLANVWLGVSVEDQERADERIPYLIQTPAAVRFVSYEPAIGPVNFECSAFDQERSRKPASPWDPNSPLPAARNPGTTGCLYEGGFMSPSGWCRLRHRIDWIIVGGESGPRARPFDIAWARQVVRQCRDAGVACFVKQLGARPYDVEKAIRVAIGTNVDPSVIGYAIDGNQLELRDSHGGDMAEWPEDLRVREFPKAVSK